MLRQLALRFRRRLLEETLWLNKWLDKLRLRLSTPRQLALRFRRRLLEETLWLNKWLDKLRLRLSMQRQRVLRLRPRLIILPSPLLILGSSDE